MRVANKTSQILLYVFAGLLIVFLFYRSFRTDVQPNGTYDMNAPVPANNPTTTPSIENKPVAPEPPVQPAVALNDFVAPLSEAKARITKKPFGIKITPGTSPVQPERFSGYHSGVDFETSADEQDGDVQIRAVCTGELVVKRYATGYGGVAVQRCRIENQDVMIVYGHVRLTSIATQQGETLLAGDILGVLGKGYSSETDGERKHLHLGIHKGTTVNIRGYVQIQQELRDWIDAAQYL
ncbi:MAG: hypothetical protein A3B30_02400 [Candidatus Komeilibacteria bacterium RIFCSPLOWO2_01_FULL_52_15]|uniref:M23ase beta-sheet core domain-containing protein n=1 Tax=Candidatus Komeilibacteria bacterium RIFCSPLOWO2_01_FULL_52_15 TaxID=1798551 RepID=A0A1G2BPL5_9BACT|nr:MAG: hypothetical protein A3B30_02400 [Candidatus Komeilibacteria bacterium RIFCSPLOWO2_01_FULL_52_15]